MSICAAIKMRNIFIVFKYNLGKEREKKRNNEKVCKWFMTWRVETEPDDISKL